jgi:hypothetical protein
MLSVHCMAAQQADVPLNVYVSSLYLNMWIAAPVHQYAVKMLESMQAQNVASVGDVHVCISNGM